MRRVRVSLCIVTTVCLLTIGCSRPAESPFHQLDGPYLGQDPPGTTPQLYAPGLISDGLFNGLIYFTAGGTEVFFSSGFERPFYISVLFHSRMENGRWTDPIEFPVERMVFHRPVLSPDGEKLLLLSSQFGERADDESDLTRIYYVERVAGEWTAPQAIDFGEAFPYSCSQASIASNGNLYFQAGYHIDGDEDIYFAEYVNGEYVTPVPLSEAINGPGHEVHPFIAPDESYLIFDAEREDGLGRNDLYVSFRGPEGDWLPAKNLGPSVNSARDERRASVSFDGRYLFFESSILDKPSRLPEQPMTLTQFREFTGSHENGTANVYWVDARVIEELRSGTN